MAGGKSIEGVYEGGDILIPGLHNDIILEHVSTKVSWRVLSQVACVNRAWKRAIEEREVYKGRKRTQSCQALLLFAVPCKPDRWQPVLYDLQQQQLVPRLPMLPQPCPARIGSVNPIGVRTVILDEKLYVLENYMSCSSTMSSECFSRLHVLDLIACHHYWKPCSAPKIRARLCVTCNGKLYAFSYFSEVVNGEVYDPKKDEWSLIVDKLHLGGEYSRTSATEVVCLNEEIYVPLETSHMRGHAKIWEIENIMAVFNTSIEEWRVTEDTTPRKPSLFLADGKLYNLSYSSVDLYDPYSNSWSMFQPVQFGEFRDPRGTILRETLCVNPLGNELLVLTSYKDFDGRRFFCRSVGFGLHGQTLVWEVLPCNDLPECLVSHSHLLGLVQV